MQMKIRNAILFEYLSASSMTAGCLFSLHDAILTNYLTDCQVYYFDFG